MSQKIYTNLDIKGNTTIGSIANATTDTDKFLVSDNGLVKYRTGAEMLSDLGVAPGVASNVQHQVKAGVAINKGQAVYVTSADGTNMIVGLASNASEATSSKTMGLLDATVAINGFANVITEGLLAGLNTIGATAGDPVWLGTGGNLIYGLINKPYAPAHLVFIGIVTRVNANNGEIFVKVQNGFELDELHDVDLKTTTPVNGHILGHNGTLWVNKTIAGWLGYTPANASGTTNYVSKFTGSNTLGNSQVFDNGTNVLIGTTTDDNYGKLRVSGGSILIDNNQQINSYKSNGMALAILKVDTSDKLVFNPLWGQSLTGYSFTINGSEKMSISQFGTVAASNDFRAPIFYDSNNTIYYLDPASTSNISRLLLNGAPASSEASLSLGAEGTNEGGQLVLNKATSYTYAAHLDIWQDEFRILYGTNTATTGGALSLNLSTRQLRLHGYTSATSYTGTAVASLAVDASGNVITLAASSGGVTSVSGTGGYGGLTLSGTVTSSGNLTLGGTPTGTWPISVSGNADTVDNLHASDFVRAYGTSNDNIDSDWGQSFKTFDPVPSGTPPLASPNIRTINIGENFGRRTQLAFDYASDTAYFRRRQDSTWYAWREFIHSGNIGSQSVSYATSAGNADTLDGNDSSAFALASHTHPYDNYQYWNLKTNGVQRTTITSNGTLDLVAGTNVSLSYGAGGVVTISSTDTNTIYTHPAYTTRSIDTSGAQVIDVFTSDAIGSVTNITTRTMTLADLGYTGATNANFYTLPTATSTVLGGVKLFSDTVQSTIANAVTATASRTYGVQVNAAGQMLVNVPWTDTVYTHPAYTARSIDTSGAQVIDVFTSDAIGSVTNITTRTMTLADIGAAAASHTHTFDSLTSKTGGTGTYQTTGEFIQNNGKYVRDSYYRTISGRSDLYSGGSEGWYTAAQVTLTTNCSGAVLYGTLNDHRYNGADSYQIAVVARAECDFESNNQSHYVNVGCTILGSTNYTNYRSKIRVVLTTSTTNNRTYQLQFFETAWNNDTWQLESNGWTIYNSPQTASAEVGTPLVNYVSNQNADYQRSNTATYAPIYYDTDDTAYYLNPNSTSNLNALNLAGDLSFGSQTATWITSNAMADSIGWNSSYGVYIGSNTLGYSSYIRGNGTFTNNTGTHNLLHADNYTTYTDPRLYRGYSTSGDFQTLQSTSGTVRFDQIGNTGAWSNAPGGYNYGGVLSLRGANFGFQLWGSHTGNFYFKTQWDNDQYSGWREVIHSGNYTSFAAPASHTHTFDSLTSKGSGTGTYTTSGDFRAPVFYDSNDTNYYVDPADTTTSANFQSKININASGATDKIGLQITNGYGNPTIGAYYSSIYTSGSFYAGHPSGAGQDVLGNGARFNIFYEKNNTAYYIDPASTSVLNTLNMSFNNNTYAAALTVTNTNTGTQAIAGLGMTSGAHSGSINMFSTGMLDILNSNTTSGSIQFRPKSTSAFHIDYVASTSRVTVGSTNTASHPLRVTQQVSNVSIYADYDIVAYSDQSVKENIRPIENVLERVNKSRGVVYDRIDSGEKNNIGFIAQELEVEFPELVVTNEDNTKAVKYQNAVAVLFEAVKEQQKQIEELKELVNKLITK